MSNRVGQNAGMNNNEVCKCSAKGQDHYYTLEPLMTRGADALVFSDILGVKSIRLTSITEYYGGIPWQRIRRDFDDCFGLMEREAFIWPPFAEQLTVAEFAVELADGRRFLTKVKTTRLTAEDLAEPIWERQGQWLEKRGFLVWRNNAHGTLA